MWKVLLDISKSQSSYLLPTVFEQASDIQDIWLQVWTDPLVIGPHLVPDPRIYPARLAALL